MRKKSFLIFHDPHAPVEEKTLNAQEIAQIEAAHEAGKKDRIDALIRQQMGIEIPKVSTEEDQLTYLWDLAYSMNVRFRKDPTREELFAAVLDKRTDGMAKHLEGADEETAKAIKGKLEYETRRLQSELPRIVTEAEVKAAKEAAAARVAGPDGAVWQEIVRMVQDESIVDENAFKEYLRTTFRQANQKYLRDFGWNVYGIVTSKAKLPDLTYRPSRTSESTVRFKDGRADRLGINAPTKRTEWDVLQAKPVDSGERSATLWVKIADGAWYKDGHFGGHLQVTCATAEGQWIDSSNGWVRPQSSKGDPVTFYDMGPYYEIWQKDRKTGRPLVVQDDYLRFADSGTPGKFNLQDAAWS
ncbi:hypothetical protein ACPCSC_06625 [Streptomyces lavendulocolor]|uniref:hypothetical protein n=1 Tax=Streptomyces lavendulocolor TaxID=67316 RepID=UPI003C2D7863